MENKLVTMNDMMALKEATITTELVKTEDFAAKYEILTAAIEQLTAVKKAIDGNIKDLIGEQYEKDGTSKIENNKFNFSYVAPTVRLTVDSAKLKSEYPDVYNSCIKSGSVAASLKVTKKKEKVADGE